MLFRVAEVTISLYNLVKQYFSNVEQETLIINSNDRVQECLKAQKNQRQEQSADGFEEGLSALELDPDALMRMQEEAQQKADMIVEAAQRSAKKIISDAQTQAGALLQEQSKKGYEDGCKKSREELEVWRGQLEQEFSAKEQELEALYQKRHEEMEPELVDAIIQVFDKVFHIQFEDKREILLHLIGDMLHNAESCKSYRIRVADANRSFLEAHLEDIRSKVGNDVEIEICGDYGMEDSGCMIETETGIFDCSIDLELSNLIRDIRSLCS